MPPVLFGGDAYGQALQVERVASRHLDDLGHHLAGREDDFAPVGVERFSVAGDLRPVGVGAVVGVERVGGEASAGGLRILAVVGQVDGESGRLAVGHAADALPVGGDLRVLNLLGALVEQGAGLVGYRVACVLPGVGGGTATSAIDETAGIDGFAVVDALVGDTVLDVVLHYLRPLVEIDVVIDVQPAHVLYLRGVGSLGQDAEHIHAEVALAAHHEVERLLAAVVVLRAVGAYAAVLCHRFQAELEIITEEGYVYTLNIIIIILSRGICFIID